MSPYDDITDEDGRAEPYFRRAGFLVPTEGTLTLHASTDVGGITASDSIIVSWEDDDDA